MPRFQKAGGAGHRLARHTSKSAREDNDFIAEFLMVRFIDLAILAIARCT